MCTDRALQAYDSPPWTDSTPEGSGMANLRRAYAATQFAHLDWSPDAERPVDRVAAGGRARLIELWKARYGQEPRSAVRMLQIMGIVFRRKFPRDPNADAIVEQALLEVISPQCDACKGGGELVYLNGKHHGDLRTNTTQCLACDGTGIGCYTLLRRACLMKIDYEAVKRSDWKINWLVSWVMTQDRIVNELMNFELDRASQFA